MSLRLGVIKTRVESMAKDLGIPIDKAFLRLAHTLLTGQSISAFGPDDLVDGGQDKQGDVITIDRSSEKKATVYIISGKYQDSFESNALVRFGNGLRWVLVRPPSEFGKIDNVALKDKIGEVRDLMNEIGPSNISISAAFCSLGDSAKISKEFNHELANIKKDFDTGVFDSFELMPSGCNELVEMLNTSERSGKQIDVKLALRFDVNNPSLIRYDGDDVKGVLCTCSAQEIARIVNDDPTDSIFDSNIRRFLGAKGSVNTDILNTCTNQKDSGLFWFLNNGITIVCDRFDVATAVEMPHVRIENFQIVNGCQTAKTLALAAKAKKLSPTTNVQVKVYQTAEKTLSQRIVRTTNNQNRITSRDLHANDAVQQDLQRLFTQYGLYYERKVNEYTSSPHVPKSKIVVNEIVGQSYVAAILKKPSDARSRRYKIWGELYDQVFKVQNAIEPYVIATQMYRHSLDWVKLSGVTKSKVELTRKLANRGAFHLTRAATRLWRASEDWSRNNPELVAQAKFATANDCKAFHSYFKTALNILKTAVKKNPSYPTDIEATLKSGSLDDDLTQLLNRKRRAAKAGE